MIIPKFWNSSQNKLLFERFRKTEISLCPSSKQSLFCMKMHVAFDALDDPNDLGGKNIYYSSQQGFFKALLDDRYRFDRINCTT